MPTSRLTRARSIGLFTVALLAACDASKPADPAEPENPATPAEPANPADPADPAAPAALTTGTWQLVEIASMDDSVFRPDPPDAFQLTFDPDGRVAVRADCNRGQGTWRFQAPSAIEFGPLATTRMACPPDSLHDRFLQNLAYVRSFVMRDGHLYLATLADGAILEFAPATGSGEPPPVDDPSFDCAGVEPGSVESMICNDGTLAALDRKLARVFEAASGVAAADGSPALRAEQRGWIKGHDECWKAGDQAQCVGDAYGRRIAELQARYRLVQPNGPVRYRCGATTVEVHYFATEPPTLMADLDGDTSLMFLERSASGSRYVGRNESLWEHQGEATLRWGYDAPERTCSREP